MGEVQDSPTISTKQGRIAQIAQKTSEAIQNIAHHIDVPWLKEAFNRTRKDGALGVDGVTASEYQLNLDENLKTLLERMKSGTYRALPARRAYIPKDKPGEMRALGIPALEDKILQRAILMAIEPVFEHDFLPCSYGFRPGRGAHDAIYELQKALHKSYTAWVVEIDIKRCFDTIPHGKLQEILRERVSDGTINRMIGKWLNAGIFESGGTIFSDVGCPQGSVMTPQTQ